MTRLSIVVASLALSVASLGGIVSAQETSTIADGGYSVSDPSNPIVADEGEVQIYGDVATGGGGGEVLGDPAGLASIQDHDVIANSVPPPVLVPEDDPAPAPAPAPVDSTTAAPVDTTTAPVESTTAVPVDGTIGSSGTTATDGTTPTETAAAPTTDTAAAPATYCGSYTTWYDAQVAYEAAGGLSGDPALVQAADPDYDGVACEELIVY